VLAGGKVVAKQYAGGGGVGILWAGLRVDLTIWEPDGDWYSYMGVEMGKHKQSWR
jgi:hypothetical protein